MRQKKHFVSSMNWREIPEIAGKNDGAKEKPEKKKKGFMDKVKEAFDD